MRLEFPTAIRSASGIHDMPSLTRAGQLPISRRCKEGGGFLPMHLTGDLNHLGHRCLGMCKECFGRTRQRMIATLRRANAERPIQEEPKDLEALAQEALAPSIEVLAKKRRGSSAQEALMPAVAALNPRKIRQR
jgi:hypothetical protein